jgi:tetratricopeptide (TPR) repeat protein
MVVLVFVAFSVMSCSRGGDGSFDSLVDAGNICFERREYVNALNAWKQAAAIKPDSAFIYHQIGLAYLRLSDFYQARIALRESVSLKPDALDVRGSLAKIELVLFNLVEAEKEIDYMLTAAPDNVEAQILYGDLLFMKNRFDAAEETYRKALRLGPESGTAFLKLAACCLAKGDTAEADRLYEAAASLKLNGPDRFVELGNYCRLRGDLENAEKHLLHATCLEPENLAYQKRLAEFYSETDRHDNALEILNKIVGKAPDNVTAKKAIAEILLTQGKLNQARLVLEGLSGGLQKDVEVNLLKGKYHMLNLETVHAVGCFQVVVEAEPDFPLGHYLLGLAYLEGNHTRLAQQSFVRALTLDPYFSEADLALADIYYKREEYELSLEYAKRVCVREPENYRAHMIMGNILLRQGEYDSALRRFLAARRIHPESLTPVYYMAMASEFSNRIEDSLKLYEEVLRGNNDLADAALRYVRLLASTGKTDQAEKFCLERIEEAPRNGFFYHILGEVCLLQGKKEKALSNFKKAVSLDPQMISSYIRIGETYDGKVERAGQIALYESALQTMPDFLEAYERLASLYLREENAEKAIETYETALKKAPESPLIANNLAWLYLEYNKDLNKALTLAQSAYERLPDDPCVADTLGWAYFRRNLATRAVWHLTDAVSGMPENPLIHYHLGMVYHSKNEGNATRSHLEKALALHLESPYQEHAAEILNELNNQTGD